MNKEQYKEYLNSREWKDRRSEALRRANYRCQVCYTKNRSLHVHHRTYDRVCRERLSDLTVLCDRCHSLYHKNKKIVKSKPSTNNINTGYSGAKHKQASSLSDDTFMILERAGSVNMTGLEFGFFRFDLSGQSGEFQVKVYTNPRDVETVCESEVLAVDVLPTIVALNETNNSGASGTIHIDGVRA